MYEALSKSQKVIIFLEHPVWNDETATAA